MSLNLIHELNLFDFVLGKNESIGITFVTKMRF